MEDYDVLLLESLNRYFSVIKNTGYMSDNKVFNLLVLLFIQELVQNNYYYITEEDADILNRIVTCLSGTSCLIPYIKHLNTIDNINTERLIEVSRKTEDDLLVKLTMEDIIRIAEL